MITAIYLWIISMLNWLFSQYCAWDDAKEINLSVFIDHRKQWITRAILAFCVTGIIANAAMVSWSVFGVSLIGVAFQFSIIFRYDLNRRRKYDWWYISWSNWYDSVFITIAGWFIDNDSPDDPMETLEYTNRVTKLGGTIAYITEVLITIAAFVFAIKLG